MSEHVETLASHLAAAEHARDTEKLSILLTPPALLGRHSKGPSFGHPDFKEIQARAAALVNTSNSERSLLAGILMSSVSGAENGACPHADMGER